MTWAAGGSDQTGVFFVGILGSFSFTRHVNFVYNTDVCVFLCYQRLTIGVPALLYLYSIMEEVMGLGP